MAKELDEILYDAIKACHDFDGCCVYDTCIPVPPDGKDNTPTPYIMVYDEGYQNDIESKDSVWESEYDHVRAAIEIAAKNPAAVRALRSKVRRAVEEYIVALANQGELTPMLTATNNDGVQWDWMKPCFYDTIHYQCDMEVVIPEES